MVDVEKLPFDDALDYFFDASVFQDQVGPELGCESLSHMAGMYSGDPKTEPSGVLPLYFPGIGECIAKDFGDFTFPTKLLVNSGQQLPWSK